MKKSRLIFVFCICACLFCSPVFAKEITIIFTGDTHAMIYHCSCPLEPDGGVARRATLIKKLRKESPHALLLDSGGLFGGGLLDQYSQNTELDKQRTLVNLKAMEKMKYDAVAVGDDEFSFGRQFFQENINKTKLKFLSCNLKADNISPFIIKNVSGVNVGIVAVSNLATRQKAEGTEVSEPVTAVATAVREARAKGANIIILLSRLGEKDDLSLISQVEGIDLLIIGKSRSKEELSGKAGNTTILRPSWEGRRLGKAVISVEDNKVSNLKAEELRLSDQIADDPDILSILPQCFSDSNCKKEGSEGACVNPGEPGAKCSFKKAGEVNLVVISSKDCIACGAEATINSLKAQFPGLVASVLLYPDKKATELINDLGITSLPAFIFDRAIEKQKNFDSFKDRFLPKGDYYLLKPLYGGLAYFLNRDQVRGKSDLFISLADKNASKVLEVSREFNPAIHFLAVEQSGSFEAANGPFEVEEYLRSVCVQKYYPEFFWEYISCRAKNINSSWWDDCLGKYNAEGIKSCSRGIEGVSLLKENISLNKDIQIMYGPTYLVDNQQIFTTKGVPTKEELKKALKR